MTECHKRVGRNRVIEINSFNRRKLFEKYPLKGFAMDIKMGDKFLLLKDSSLELFLLLIQRKAEKTFLTKTMNFIRVQLQPRHE